MTITISDADGGMDDIIRQVVAAIMKDKGDRLKLISASQACGILDVTPGVFYALDLPKIDVLGNGRTVRYRLEDVEAALEERTIKSLKRRKSA